MSLDRRRLCSAGKKKNLPQGHRGTEKDEREQAGGAAERNSERPGATCCSSATLGEGVGAEEIADGFAATDQAGAISFD